MAEVLSQSQIDMLINAAMNKSNDSGGGGGSGSTSSGQQQPAEAKTETKIETKAKKYQKYDFRSPRKYTKERLKMLNGVFENYSKVLNTRINGLMHTTCEVEVDSVDEQRYFEFSNALIDGEVVSLAYMQMNEKRTDAPVIICASPTIMVSMMDHMMGGNGDVADDLPIDYTYTNIDLSLYQSLMKDFVALMGGSWENYVHLKFAFERVEPNPTLVQLISIEETVVLISLNIKFPNCEGRIDICLPDTVLSNIFAEITRANSARRAEREDHSDDIYSRIQDSSLEITAELGRTTVQLKDLYCLNVGDVIDMNMKKNSAVALRIAGRQWFCGQMGTHEKHLAVKIQEVYSASERGSEQEDER